MNRYVISIKQTTTWPGIDDPIDVYWFVDSRYYQQNSALIECLSPQVAYEGFGVGPVNAPALFTETQGSVVLQKLLQYGIGSPSNPAEVIITLVIGAAP